MNIQQSPDLHPAPAASSEPTPGGAISSPEEHLIHLMLISAGLMLIDFEKLVQVEASCRRALEELWHPDTLETFLPHLPHLPQLQ